MVQIIEKRSDEMPDIPFPDLIDYGAILNTPTSLKNINPSESDTLDMVREVIVDGHYIDDALDTATRTILGDFTFGESGALVIAVDGSTGTWISALGILHKTEGVTDFALDADGAFFGGIVMASAIIVGTSADLLEQAALSNYPPDTNLIGYWAFDEGSGTVANDGSNNGHNGVITGATFVTGVKGTALEFDGNDDSVNCGDITQLNGVSSFSVSFWAKQDVLDVADEIFGKYKNSNNWILFQTEATGNLRCYIGDNSSTASGQFDYSAVVSAGVFFHCVVVYDGSQTGNANRLKIYINGVQQSLSFTGTIPATTVNLAGYNFYIGSYEGVYAFDGVIDDFRLYSSVLTPAQIYSVYKNPGQGKSLAVPIGRICSGQFLSKQIMLGAWIDPADPLDTFIAAGKNDFTNVDVGWILGRDYSAGNKPKLYFGDSKEYFNLTYDDVLGAYVIRNTMRQQYEAGDVTLLAADAEQDFTDTNYVKKKVLQVGRAGTYRVRYNIGVYPGGTVYARLYKGITNGATENEAGDVYIAGDSATAATYFNHDVYCEKGEYLKIWCKVDNGAYLGNIKLTKLRVAMDLETSAPVAVLN